MKYMYRKLAGFCLVKGRIRFQCLFDEVYANFVGRAKW